MPKRVFKTDISAGLSCNSFCSLAGSLNSSAAASGLARGLPEEAAVLLVAAEVAGVDAFTATLGTAALEGSAL